VISFLLHGDLNDLVIGPAFDMPAPKEVLAIVDEKKAIRRHDHLVRSQPLAGGTAGYGVAGSVQESGVQPAIVRAHARAFSLPVMPVNNQRSSTTADNSPPRSKAARIAATSASDTTTQA
jgi:hypothetical protein